MHFYVDKLKYAHFTILKNTQFLYENLNILRTIVNFKSQ